MKPLKLKSFAEDRWLEGGASGPEICSAVTGEVVAHVGPAPDYQAMVAYARRVGGPALRRLTFPERARLLKATAEALLSRKEELYALSIHAGATRSDAWIDIEGGAGALFSCASKARRELPDAKMLLDGAIEVLGKAGGFIGQHVLTSRQGVAVHINAFNFPVWGLLEKLGPALLGGAPVIVKAATATAYVAERAVKIISDAGTLPTGALQLVVGTAGDLLDHLEGQDLISFTGSAETAARVKGHPMVLREGVRVIAEQDSLNASVLGPEAAAGDPEFDLFTAEVVREMTVKAGQKCTAIRRILVPRERMDEVQAALAARLAEITVGDPGREDVRMGPLVSLAQRAEVRRRVGEIASQAAIVWGNPERVAAVGGDPEAGAFFAPVLLRADSPWSAGTVHEVEAFGPVAALMPYDDAADAIALANRGKGSLALSVFSHDASFAADVVAGASSHHGRLVIVDRDCARESTGHGSPLPALVHGGPGRAGGGEEMGGLRALGHYLQRTALQGSPKTLSAICGTYLPGAPREVGSKHPFHMRFGELTPGYTLDTPSRQVSVEEIEAFAHLTGDTYYLHMDDEAAEKFSIFKGRVAHGYLVLSFAAGLFVDPAPGPVLANYGLEELRFLKPVRPEDAIRVRLTVKSKSQRNPDMGEVRWAVEVWNQSDELVATYDLLTMNAV